MKFLDINLTKDSSLFLHAIHSPFYWRILEKTILGYSGFKNPGKNPRNKKIQIFSWIAFWRLEFMPRNLDKKCRSRIPSQWRYFLSFDWVYLTNFLEPRLSGISCSAHIGWLPLLRPLFKPVSSGSIFHASDLLCSTVFSLSSYFFSAAYCNLRFCSRFQSLRIKVP